MSEVPHWQASIGTARRRQTGAATPISVIRYWSDAPTATLAWRSRSGEVQDRPTRLQVPPRARSPVPLWLLRPVQVSSTRASLRSARFQERLLIVPRTKTKTIGPRGFFHASPTVWNSLPDDLRDPELSISCFRNKLKTFLFTIPNAYAN